MKAFSRYTILGLVLFFLITAAAITVDGFRDEIATCDVAIVLGSKVNANGQLSARLAARLYTAVELYRQGVFPNVIVSGGTGKEGVDEAQAMQTYLLTQGIPTASIFVDSHGNTTFDTAENSAAIMHAHGFKSALVVTQYFHISRSRLALEKCGVTHVYHAHPTFFEWRDIYSLTREVFGFYEYLFSRRSCTI